MSLKCGIVGLPNVGVITVPDERLTKLAELVHPGRIVPATCEIVDIAGLVKDHRTQLSCLVRILL